MQRRLRVLRFSLGALLSLAAVAAPTSCSGPSSSPAANPPAEAATPIDSAGPGDASDAFSPDQGVGESGTMISNTPESSFEAEDQIAVAPDGRIAITWISFGKTPTIRYRFSADDGASFTPIQSIALPAGFTLASDPAIAANPKGGFHLAFLAVHWVPGAPEPDLIRVYVVSAAPGSAEFGAPVEAGDPARSGLLDHVKIFVTRKGTIVVGYAQLNGDPVESASGVVATSNDGGATWSRSMISTPPDPPFVNMYSFCEGSEALYAIFWEVDGSQPRVSVRKSSDEGATWSASSSVVSGTDTAAGADPTCAAAGSELWVAYGTTNHPATSEASLEPLNVIRVAHSSDSGRTFDKPVDALDTATSSIAVLPVLTREPISGALDVVYIGGAADGDTNGSFRWVRADDGRTFSRSRTIDAPITFDRSRAGTNWLGDYLGAVFHGDSLYVAYPRNDSGTSHIYFRKVVVR